MSRHGHRPHGQRKREKEFAQRDARRLEDARRLKEGKQQQLPPVGQEQT